MALRKISYAQAIREAFALVLARDHRVFVIGQGVWSPWYVGSTMKDLDKEFGRSRIIESPISENGANGFAVGAALAGQIPVVVHPRMDFAILGVDQIVNQAANWSYVFGGQANVPIVFRTMINRGGEQGAQHSQALHAWFMHTPGVKVVMPSTPYDAKGLLIASINDGNPVIYIDDRWLYGLLDHVPEAYYAVPIGKGVVRREGNDVTIVGVSYMAVESLKAAEELSAQGISAEVIDPRTIKPLDLETIVTSLRKTGRLVVADPGWLTCGISAEIAALAGSAAFEYLRAPVERVALPDAPAPSSAPLEAAYYPRAPQIVAAALRTMGWKSLRQVDGNHLPAARGSA